MMSFCTLGMMKWVLREYAAGGPISTICLRGIPTISIRGANTYFDTIDAKRTVYENLFNGALFLECFGLDHGIILDVLSHL